mgnify:CR=1 FL=1
MEVAFTIAQIETFLLVMTRVGGIFFFAPIFGGRPIPAVIKVSMTLWFSFSFLPAISPTQLPLPSDGFTMVAAVITELMIGASIGLVGQVINAAVQFGGHVIGTHMGFRIANVFDPSTEESVTILGAFLNVVVVLLLLTFDFHLILIDTIARSYEMIPIFGAVFSLGIVEVLLRMGSYFFVFAVQVVLPVLAAIFFTEVMIGVMAKVARQFNMLMLQFPIKISIGMLFFFVVFKGLPDYVEYMLKTTVGQIHLLIQYMSP